MTWRQRAGLALRNLIFTRVVPAAGAVYGPWWILRSSGARPIVWAAVVLMPAGAGLYCGCVWVFAAVGRGTPGPWDAPRRFVAVGPYRWVRNPIYIAAFLVVGGEALLFLSLQLAVYLAVLALGAHLCVVGYEERVLLRRFGHEYTAYQTRVRRWAPHPPPER